MFENMMRTPHPVQHPPGGLDIADQVGAFHYAHNTHYWRLVKMEVVRDCGVGVVDLAWGIGGAGEREASMECFAEGVLGVVQGFVGGGELRVRGRDVRIRT
jgi:hypothetical protein